MKYASENRFEAYTAPNFVIAAIGGPPSYDDLG